MDGLAILIGLIVFISSAMTLKALIDWREQRSATSKSMAAMPVAPEAGTPSFGTKDTSRTAPQRQWNAADEALIRARLSEAMETGEVLRIAYHGGSTPGAHRDIAPVEFLGDEKVWADCLRSGERKQYFIWKMELLDVQAPLHAWPPSREAIFKPERGQEPADGRDGTPHPVREAFYLVCDECERIGWRIDCEHEDGIGGLWTVQLRGFFNNGKPRKTASVMLTYLPLDGPTVITFGAPEPGAAFWSVYTPSESQDHEDRSAALRAFLEAARMFPPVGSRSHKRRAE